MLQKKVPGRLYHFAIILVIITIPLVRGANNFAIALLILTWLFGMGGFSKENIGRLRKNKAGMLGIVIVLLSAIGLLYTENDYEGIRNLESLAPLLIFPVVLTGIESLKKLDAWKLSKMFVYVVLAVAIMMIGVGVLRTMQGGIYYADPENGLIHNNFLYQRLTSSFGLHPVFLSLYVDFSLLILIHDLLTKSNTRSKVLLKVLMIVFFTGFVIMLKSGISALSLGLCLILYLFLFPLMEKKSRFFSYIRIVIPFLAVAAFSTIFLKVDFKNDVFDYDKDWVPPEGNWNAINLRLALWSTCIRAIEESEIIGVGTGDGEDVLTEYYIKEDFIFAELERFQPHNQFLFTTLTLGAGGLIIILLFLGSSLYTSFNRSDLLQLSLVILFLGFCMTDIVLNRNKSLLFFTFFFNLYEYRGSTEKS